MTRRLAVLLLGSLLAATAPAAAQDSRLLVIVGLGGEPETSALFHRWALSLVAAARDQGRLPADHIVYLGEDPARDPKEISGRSTREGIEAAIDQMAAQSRPGDRVFIVLIGHGAAAAGETRFNLPGPDLGARDFARLLDRLAAQTVVFVNTASASGGFVPVLAGRDRVIIAATKTEGERNETRFAEFFVEAMTAPEADLDKDGRVSMLEAFAFARRRVGEWYGQERQLLTEHAVLDDNGDGAGSDEPGQPGADGALARTLFLAADAGTSRAVPADADPALRALYEERRALEGRIADLKAARDHMDAAAFEREMEQLLIDLARKNREIREKEKK